MRPPRASGHVVVVGVDGTDDGRRALRYGLSEARRKGQQVRLVHAWRDPAFVAPRMPYAPGPLEREAGAEVLFAAEREARSWGFPPSDVETVLLHGQPVAGLLAHQHDASCLVLGSRRHRPARGLGGSTTTGLATRATVPVHCVPEEWDPAGPELRRVVVGADGSETTGAVVAGGLAEARCRSARLEVVHAWWPTEDYDLAAGADGLAGEWEEVARAALTRMVEAVAGPVPEVRWTVKLYFERPAAALAACSADADLMVLGRRARLGPVGLGLGSTTRALLATATCPLVVLPVLRRADQALDDDSVAAATA